MKKSTVISLLAALLLIVSGCATTVSIPDRLDKFVEKTEKECKDYSEEDWNKSREEYEALVAEIKDNYDSYSTSEKVQAMKAMSRYGALVLGNEIGNVSESVGGILEQIPETINDLIDKIDTAAIRKNVDEIKSGLEGLAEIIDTARLRQKLEAVIKIFGGE